MSQRSDPKLDVSPSPRPSRRQPAKTCNSARWPDRRAIVVLTGFLVVRGLRASGSEWTLLQGDRSTASRHADRRLSAISLPSHHYARGPAGLVSTTTANESLLVVALGERVSGITGFVSRTGDIDQASRCDDRRPSSSRVRSTIRWSETDGGEIWQRIPPEAAGRRPHAARACNCVYPVIVLGKVQVVNDLVEDHPFLIAINLLAPPNEAFSIFDADLDGHRVTMAADAAISTTASRCSTTAGPRASGSKMTTA